MWELLTRSNRVQLVMKRLAQLGHDDLARELRNREMHGPASGHGPPLHEAVSAADEPSDWNMEGKVEDVTVSHTGSVVRIRTDHTYDEAIQDLLDSEEVRLRWADTDSEEDR